MSPEVIALLFALGVTSAIEPRYNIAPSQLVPIVRLDAEGHRVFEEARWGFIPWWAKETGRQPINARSETVRSNHLWRDAYKRCRCLLPVSGYYEWMASPSGPKKAYRIAMPDSDALAFVGVWSHWRAPNGDAGSDGRDGHQPCARGDRSYTFPRPNRRAARGL